MMGAVGAIIFIAQADQSSLLTKFGGVFDSAAI